MWQGSVERVASFDLQTWPLQTILTSGNQSGSVDIPRSTKTSGVLLQPYSVSWSTNSCTWGWIVRGQTQKGLMNTGQLPIGDFRPPADAPKEKWESVRHPQADQQFLLSKESFVDEALHLPVGTLPPTPGSQAQSDKGEWCSHTQEGNTGWRSQPWWRKQSYLNRLPFENNGIRLSENSDKAADGQCQEDKGKRKNINPVIVQTPQDNPLQGNDFQSSHKLDQRIFHFHFNNSCCPALVSQARMGWQSSS